MLQLLLCGRYHCVVGPHGGAKHNGGVGCPVVKKLALGQVEGEPELVAYRLDDFEEGVDVCGEGLARGKDYVPIVNDRQCDGVDVKVSLENFDQALGKQFVQQ